MPDFRRVCWLSLLGLASVLVFTPDLLAQRRNLYARPNAPARTVVTVRTGPTYPVRYTAYYNSSAINPVYVGTPGYYAYPYYGSRYGSYLQGVASVTTATGEYYNQIQQARILREQSRQMAIDTKRKQIEFEMWHDSVRPTAPKLMAQQKATDLNWARNHAQNTEIWSGRTLNVLLRSILESSQPTQGPSVPLSDTALKGLNLTDGSKRGNLSLAKDQGKINWPEALAAESFDEIRDRFNKNFETAIRQTRSGTPSRLLMNNLRADLKRMEEKLDDQIHDLSPTDWTRASRLLKQIDATVKGLADPRLVKVSHTDWRQDVKTVSDLVDYCLKNGLQFGPAVDGDEASYLAVYQALRNYERCIASAR